jgi:glycosyl-4,4'-diaponeurosporenoate acyltransferase
MDDTTTVLVDAAAWAALSVVWGYAGHRLPASRLRHDNAVTTLRSFEDDGDMWQRRVAVRRWKDRLPEAGSFFGGQSKKHLRGRAGIETMLVETRRAELVHWALVASSPGFALWSSAPLTGAMIAFAIVANAPCIIVQRFNRGRLLRLESRRTVSC